MENENIPQPLDTLMTKLGLTNADLVRASTEQLSFKVVQKGRKGRRLTSNMQEKILNAFLALKPGLRLKRRDLFRYELNESVVEQIQNALAQIRERKINYPQFVDLLIEAGMIAYTAEVGPNRITFFGTAGKAYIEQGPAVSGSAPGSYDETAIRSAIADAQQGIIDHAAFLKRIHEAGIAVYEVNLRSRKIEYKGADQSYKENIPSVTPEGEIVPPKAVEKKVAKKSAKAKKNKNTPMTRKARLSFNKRYFAKKKRARSRPGR